MKLTHVHTQNLVYSWVGFGFQWCLSAVAYCFWEKGYGCLFIWLNGLVVRMSPKTKCKPVQYLMDSTINSNVEYPYYES